MKPLLPKGLYLILGRESCGDRDLLSVAGEAIEAGVRMIQYREKGVSRRETYRVAKKLVEMTRSREAFLIVNDEVDLAMAVRADGVHLGDTDFPPEEARRILGPDYLIGLSTHSLEEALVAGERGANYIGFGPIFDSPSKQGRSPVGLDALRRVTGAVSVPVFAIGGIRPDDARSIMAAGAQGFAVIHGVLGSPDVPAAIRAYREKMDPLPL